LSPRSLSPLDHTILQSGRAVVATLPAGDREFAAYGVARFNGPGEQLVRWTHGLPHAHTNQYVVAIGRFSNPPVLADVDGLLLDDRDLEDLQRCRPGDCEVQLSAAEIRAIRKAIDGAGPRWRAEAQAAFRRLMVERARLYLQSGLAGAPPYHDHDQPVSPARELSAVLAREAVETGGIAPSVGHPISSAGIDTPTEDSFLYWSKEVFNGAKPIVSIVHGRVIRLAASTGVEALRVETQVYATHYFSASLTLIGVSRPGGDGAARHLVYRRRVRGAVFDGAFGGVVRALVARRIRKDAPAAIELLRRQIAEADRSTAATTRRW